MSETKMSTPTLLSRLEEMVSIVNSTNATNDKIDHLKKFPDLQPFLKLLMDPLQTTGVSQKKIEAYGKKRSSKKVSATAAKKRKTNQGKSVSTFTTDLTELVEKLFSREYSGDEAKDAVLHLIDLYPKHADMIYKVVEKNLQTRLGVKQINSAFPNLIPQFEVALAEDFHKKQKYFEKHEEDKWFISRKFDGVRVIAKRTNSGTKCYSRKGNHFPALQRLEDMLTLHLPSGWVLDGEICVLDEDGSENFRESVSQIKRKSVVMEKFRYYVFDLLTVEEFDAKESSLTLSERNARWNTLMSGFPHKDAVTLVSQTLYTTMDDLVSQSEKAVSEGWEGLMLRRDAPYKGKRSNDILKYKTFQTEEYKVLDVEMGPWRAIDPDSKLEVTIDTMVSVVIEHKGYKVNVGSGFKLSERQKFYDDPDLIKGQMIAVQYFEETVDPDTGNLSLRFPTYKGLYGTERDL